MRDKRSRLRRRFVWALAQIVCAASVHAQPEDRWGWNYCSPPYPPTCVETTVADPAATKACAEEVDRYIAAVYSYRTCKARELERAILEANRVSSAFKCRTEKKYCDLFKVAH
jgi:CRISPR/Cas system-associated exonuclease Cas4 (RecB family)